MDSAETASGQSKRIVRILFGLGITSVGVLILKYGYSVILFGPAPPSWEPWLKVVGYVSAIIMLGTGVALLFERASRVAMYILLPFLLLWTVSRVPIVIMAPGREISWFGVGEIAVLVAGAIVLFTRLADLRAGTTVQRITREYGLRTAWILFGLSLLTYGLSHFFEFAARTVSLVPPWLPYRAAWAYLAGAAQIAAGLGVLFSIYPRISAAMEAAMLSAFTVLVWIPAVVTKPASASNWVEFLFTFALACAAWVIAESIPGGRSEHMVGGATGR
jgi:uncharacterized membrane protein